MSRWAGGAAASPAYAAGRDAEAEAVALEANRVRDELCADGALADTTRAAKSMAEVTAHRILVGSAAGLGVAALTSFIIGGRMGGDARRAELPITVAVVPSGDGASFVLGGRW